MNILLTSVGRRGYLVKYFKEAIGENGKLYVSNSDENSPAFLYADGFVITPLIYDDNYISFLLNYCQTNNIDIVISLFDIDLYMLAKNREIFEKNGIRLVVSNESFIKVCNDKWETYNYFVKNHIQTPKTYLTIENAKSAIEKKEVNYPLIVKPRWGMGSLEVFKADNEEELNIFYNKIKRNVLQTYLRYESNQDLDNYIIIQEMINGTEYGVDVINDLNGNYVVSVIKEKISMRAGETDTAIIISNPEIEILTQRLSKITEHIANLDVDILEKDNKYYFLEMNARFGGGYPFTHLAGVNLPLAIIKWWNGEIVNLQEITPTIGIKGQKDINIVKL